MGAIAQAVRRRGQLAADAAHVAAGHQDAAAAKQWATLAYKWYTIELGSDSKQSRTALLISRTPESHGAWGSREMEQVGGTEELS
ncbi:SET domain-containing protein [Ceratobasidium sp. AG-Ba]|nr:SET domain-containing protein [Ceratobasidium sp. AG-Ba]QRW03658.1 SET domain-containing protein [Ceratobasidium sp. AG-Ba]